MVLFVQGGLLGHFDVAFVELKAFAVEQGAEGEVADDYEEDAGDHTGDDGCDVGPTATVS